MRMKVKKQTLPKRKKKSKFQEKIKVNASFDEVMNLAVAPKKK